jgi:hypothetical protein
MVVIIEPRRWFQLMVASTGLGRILWHIRGELGIEEPKAARSGSRAETIERMIHGNTVFFIDQIEEPTVHLTIRILLLNMIGWLWLIISRINVGAPLVPPISKYKIQASTISVTTPPSFLTQPDQWWKRNGSFWLFQSTLGYVYYA